jgi:hypothetical protein
MENNSGAKDAQKLKTPLKFIIEGEDFETYDQYKTGAELKELKGIPLDTELYLCIAKPYNDELIENDKFVNIARPDTEYFFVKKKLHFTINEVPFVWYKQFIRGIQIRELGKINPEDDLYLDLKEGYEDDFITDDEIVDLARPGKEKFFSKKHDQNFVIIVNSRDKSWGKRTITFEEVVALAEGNSNDGNKAYTVTYVKGPKQNPRGEMAKGDVVYVINKMIFNATPTDKS